MTHLSWVKLSSMLGVLFTLLLYSAAVAAEAAPSENRVTILYDAFGKASPLRKDWGFSALIEYNGKRILFDAGDNNEIFAHNIKALGVDLATLDFVVISHRHGDHIAGLTHLLEVNPKVKIYAPKEGFGVFGSSLPSTFYRKAEFLPAKARYYDGAPPAMMHFGTAWPTANFELVEQTTEIAPGIHLIALVSDKPGTLELRELSLAIDTPEGIVLVVGCSHPGVDTIVEAASAINPHIHLVLGGYHLVVASDAEIARVTHALHDTWRVDYVAPGHCTGEPSFAALKKAFGKRYVYAGLGTTFLLGRDVRTTAHAAHNDTETLSSNDMKTYRALALLAQLAEDT